MKKLAAVSLAIAMGLGLAFAEDANAENKGQIASLSSAAGKISFGAWGRSTFMFGNKTTKSEIEASNAAAESGAASQAAAINIANTAIPVINAMADETSESYAQVAPDWSYGCRVGFWIIGRTTDEKWGFDFNLDADGRALLVQANGKSSQDYGQFESGKAAVAIGDQAKMWAIFDELPLFDVKVAFGKMRENELVGAVGDFGQRESSDTKTDDDLFTRFNPYMGLFTSLSGKKGTALEGLYIAGDVDACDLVFANKSDSTKNLTTGLYDVIRKGQAGIGYTIPGLFQIKAQMWGDTIAAENTRYPTTSTTGNGIVDARNAGFDGNDYLGRAEFGFKWLGFTGGATGLGDVDLSKTPNANVMELGVKVPVITDENIRQYDPEHFYNYYAVFGTMGVIQQGFILYKAHVFLGQGKTDLKNYSSGFVQMTKDKPADILMTGFDALAEVCLDPFGKQRNFLGLSFNYGLTYASGNDSVNNVTLQQHKIGAELYYKRTFAANNYFFIGVADRLSIAKIDGTINLDGILKSNAAYASYAGNGALCDLKYTLTTNQVYIPVGVEMFF